MGLYPFHSNIQMGWVKTTTTTTTTTTKKGASLLFRNLDYLILGYVTIQGALLVHIAWLHNLTDRYI